MNESVDIPIPAPAISLRRLTLADIDAFMVWATEGEVARFCTWEAYQSKEEGVEFINKVVVPHPWFRGIWVDDEGPVGSISVTENKSSGDRCRGELGYVLGSKYWGKGIMTEAVKMGVGAVFREREELERVEALVDIENVRSQRVLEKAGFKREGVLRKYVILKGRTRDMVIYSFLSTDPIPP